MAKSLWRWNIAVVHGVDIVIKSMEFYEKV